MKWLLLCLLVLACSPTEARWRVYQAQTRFTWRMSVQPAAPSLAAEWVNDRLIVTSAPGCLYLVGGGRPAVWVGCDQATYTLAPFGDQSYIPMGRTLVLRDELAQTEIGRLAVPSRVVVGLPWVMN